MPPSEGRETKRLVEERLPTKGEMWVTYRSARWEIET